MKEIAQPSPDPFSYAGFPSSWAQPPEDLVQSGATAYAKEGGRAT